MKKEDVRKVIRVLEEKDSPHGLLAKQIAREVDLSSHQVAYLCRRSARVERVGSSKPARWRLRAVPTS